MKRILLSLAVLCIISTTFAQNKMRVEVQVKGLQDTTLILGYHYGSKKLVADTIRVDSKGKGVFKRDTLMDAGLYLVLTPNMRYFEIILDKDQEFKVTTDTADLFTNLKFEGSVDNQVFLDYQNKSSDLYKKRKPVFDKLKWYYDIKDTTIYSKKQREIQRDSIKILQNQLETIRKEMIAYEDGIIKAYPTSLLSSILLCTRELDIPDYPRNEKGEITDSLFKYTYMKNHYFDKVQLGDSRLLRTPVYEMKIENYFDRELLQIPDSIIPEVDKLMGKILEQEKKGYEGKMYYYTLHHMFMKYQNPKYMGLDNIFVYIMEQYYLKKKLPAKVIADTAYMAKIEKRYNEMSKNRIGIKAPNFVAYSNKDEWMQLNSIQADYIVLYFWDTDCGHCKKTIPEWHDLYVQNEFKKKGVACILFYTQTEMEQWKKFIVDKGLDDCINVFDPYQNTNFRQNYDIYSTPVSYVLDKNKKIIAKRIPPETIVDLLNHELERNKKTQNTTNQKQEQPAPNQKNTSQKK
ncbi:MAG TPA: redoxin domain-containing protein [Bacteroidales bacterium]|jgi:peroxiredoxin|nr:redoxin domain-containing protein [Bacteroidales bacterium]HRS17937.1 redoxin domain-containing protein [Bacteroidales bacterium]